MIKSGKWTAVIAELRRRWGGSEEFVVEGTREGRNEECGGRKRREKNV